MDVKIIVHLGVMVVFVIFPKTGSKRQLCLCVVVQYYKLSYKYQALNGVFCSTGSIRIYFTFSSNLNEAKATHIQKRHLVVY